MATESKGCCDCCTAGRWHLLPPRPLSRFILRPPPSCSPEAQRKSTVAAFSAASLFLSQRGRNTHIPKQTHTQTRKKRSGPTSRPFVRFFPRTKVLFIALRCVIPTFTHRVFLMGNEKQICCLFSLFYFFFIFSPSKKDLIFKNKEKQKELCLSRSLTRRLLLHSVQAKICCGV